MQGTAIPYLDMGGASIKMNDDGSFNLLVGATDLGTGSDTVLAQMAAEVLGVPLEDMICYSSDTDFTPFDKGAYASSTTYISGTAAVNAAKIVAERIKVRAAMMLKARNPNIEISDLIESASHCARWTDRSIDRNRPRFAAQKQSGTDHGRGESMFHLSRRLRSRRNLPKSLSTRKPARSPWIGSSWRLIRA